MPQGERRRRSRRRRADPLGSRRRCASRADPEPARGRRRASPPRSRRHAPQVRAADRDRRGARGASHRAAARLRRRLGESVSRLRIARRPDSPGPAAQRHAQRRGEALHQGAQQGRAEGDVEDGHLDAAELLRRADLRGDRPRSRLRREVLHVHRIEDRRHRPEGDLRRSPSPSRARLRLDAVERSAERRRIPVAARRRAAPVQPGHGLQAAARDALGPIQDLQGIHRARQRSEQGARDAARTVRPEAVRSAGADRRSRAAREDPAALLDRRDVVRIDQPGSARNAGHRHESHGREVEHRRRRRGSGALRSRCERRFAAQRDQAGGVGPLRRHERIPRQRRRSADQDGAGRQAR